jgi:hypothetical protein
MVAASGVFALAILATFLADRLDDGLGDALAVPVAFCDGAGLGSALLFRICFGGILYLRTGNVPGALEPNRLRGLGYEWVDG